MNDILGEDFPFSENILDGKTALVCGASRGIGRSTALLLARAGARVIACARNKELLEELVSEMHGSGHEALVLDLEDTDAVRACADSLADRKITILINNAGGPPRSPLLQNDLGDFDGPFKRHLHASHILVKNLAPGMEAYGSGRIVNILSLIHI